MAAVALPQGQHVLVRSGTPLETSDGKPIDLDLVHHGAAFAPSAPLISTTLGATSGDGVRFGDGLGVIPSGAGDVPAEQTANRLFYANTATDTDFMVAPLPSGVETWWQLRSERSPVDESLKLSLPAGDSLASTVTGSVEIDDRAGHPAWLIPPASAVDAAGNPVPVSYSVDSDAVRVHVATSTSTEFPVMVDPAVLGLGLGTVGDPTWTDWHNNGAAGYSYPLYANVAQVFTQPDNSQYNGAPGGSMGEWYFAATSYVPGTVRIYRADVASFTHEPGYPESYFALGIWGDSNAQTGSDPIYTRDGTQGPWGSNPWIAWDGVDNTGVAFCAQYGGGADGSSTPLCDDNYNAPSASGGDYFVMQLYPQSGRSVGNYVQFQGVSIDETDNTPPYLPNLGGTNSAVPDDWLSSWSTSVSGGDPGIGVSGLNLYLQSGFYNPVPDPGNGPPSSPSPWLSASSSCTNAYQGALCNSMDRINFSTPVTGLYTLEAIDWNPFSISSHAWQKVATDTNSPTITFSGPLTGGATVTDGTYNLGIHTQDGTDTAPASGVRGIEVDLDGTMLQTFGNPNCGAGNGPPAPSTGQLPGDGCYVDDQTIPVTTSSLSQGQHTIQVCAWTWANAHELPASARQSQACETLSFTVHDAVDTPIGPGSVNLLTGAFKMRAQDVSVPSPGVDLDVGRTYTSMPGPATAGLGAPLGTYWNLELPSLGASPVDSIGTFSFWGFSAATLTLGSGSTVTAYKASSATASYTMPTGWEGWTLSPPSTGSASGLCPAGSTMTLTSPSGAKTIFAQVTGQTNTYVPCVAAAPGQREATSALYETDPGGSGIVPQLLLAPVPAGVTCNATTLQAGCRALKFVYATSTTATSSTTGDYAGQLSEIDLVAYNPAAGAMATTAVARYAYDSSGLLRQEWDPRITPNLPSSYTYSGQVLVGYTPAGQTPWSFGYPRQRDPHPGSPRLQTVTRADPQLTTASAWTIAYNVPLSGTGAPNAMDSASVAKWGQSDAPASATAIFPPGASQTDYSHAEVFYLDIQGREVNLAEPGGRIATTQYDSSDNVAWTLTAADRAEALQSSNPAAQAGLLATTYTYNAASGSLPAGAEVVDELGPQHTLYVPAAGGGAPTKYTGRTDTRYTYDTGAPSTGGPYYLVTKKTEGAQVSGQSSDLDVRTTVSDYSGQSGLGWQLRKPTSVTIQDGSGATIEKHSTTYDSTTGFVTGTTTPKGSVSDAHTTVTTFYTAAANSAVPACGGHPELAGFVCQSGPAAQPATGQQLPVTTTTYNMLGEPLTLTAAANQATRTTTNTYDAAGRITNTTVTSSTGTAVPAVTYAYDPATGLPTTTTGADGHKTTVAYDTLGRVASYTDADGNTSTYSYDIDGRPATANDGKGTQTWSYDPLTGDTTGMVDSALGAFSAAYNADGNMTSETYPNGMQGALSIDETADRST